VASERAGRRFVAGRLGQSKVVVAFSRWGKVAAASTATELLLAHGVDRIVFSGIAGGLDPRLAIGDVVIADQLFQHDLDASPFFAPTEIPLLGARGIAADPRMSSDLASAARAWLADHADHDALPAHARPSRAAQLYRGDIASGDQVISTEDARRRVLAAVPSALCVEMEGAAVAQVCFEHRIPFACIRTISDSADHGVVKGLADFLGGLAAAYTVGIITRWLCAK
jgi:adenosylhomocysteine nucleosidase